MENIQIEQVTSFSLEIAENIRHLASILDVNHQSLSDSDIEGIVSSDATTLIIARDIKTNNVIGMITLVTYRIPYKMKGWMEDLVVEEAYRGKGIATALIEKTIELAREKTVKSLDFTSQPHREAANKLYGKLGFQKRETNVYRLVIE